MGTSWEIRVVNFSEMGTSLSTEALKTHELSYFVGPNAISIQDKDFWQKLFDFEPHLRGVEPIEIETSFSAYAPQLGTHGSF